MSAILRQGTGLVLYVEAALGAAAAFFRKEWVGVASAAAAAAFLVSSRILLRDAGKSPGKFEGKTVKRIFEFTGFLACDPQVMIHGTQAAALLSAARTHGFIMKIVMCAAAAVVALLGDFAFVRVLAVLLGVYLYGSLAVNRGDLLGLRTCPTFASLASVGRLFELKDQVLTLVFQAWARATIFVLATTTLLPQPGGQVDLQGSPWMSLPTSAQQQQAAAANEESPSLSTQGGHSSFQAMVVSLEGKTGMIPTHSWGLVAELHDAVGVVLGMLLSFDRGQDFTE